MDTCHLRIENKTLQQHIYETLGNGREYIKLSVDRNYVTTLFSNSNVPQTQQLFMNLLRHLLFVGINNIYVYI